MFERRYIFQTISIGIALYMLNLSGVELLEWSGVLAQFTSKIAVRFIIEVNFSHKKLREVRKRTHPKHKFEELQILTQKTTLDPTVVFL